MGYRKPDTVIAPKNRWQLGPVLCDTGQGGWSVVEGFWEEKPVLGIRWNGDDDTGGYGNPQSHGNPTWFIIPSELESAIREMAGKVEKAMCGVNCEFSTPDGYQPGVFMVKMVLNERLVKATDGYDWSFPMPDLPRRFFRQEAEYFVPPTAKGGPHRGQFKNGVWQAIVQTNGVPEDENPTKLDIVRDALISSVITSLRPWTRE